MGIILTTVLVVMLAGCGGQTAATEPKEPTEVVNPSESATETIEPEGFDEEEVAYSDLIFADDLNVERKTFYLPSNLAEDYKNQEMDAYEFWRWLVGDFIDVARDCNGMVDLSIIEAGTKVKPKQFYFEKASYEKFKSKGFNGSVYIFVVKKFTDEELIDMVDFQGNHPTKNNIGYMLFAGGRIDNEKTQPALKINVSGSEYVGPRQIIGGSADVIVLFP